MEEAREMTLQEKLAKLIYLDTLEKEHEHRLASLREERHGLVRRLISITEDGVDELSVFRIDGQTYYLEADVEGANWIKVTRVSDFGEFEGKKACQFTE